MACQVFGWCEHRIYCIVKNNGRYHKKRMCHVYILTFIFKLCYLCKTWSCHDNKIQWSLLRRTAAPRCEGFPMFWYPALSPSSGCAGGLVLPNHQHTLKMGTELVPEMSEKPSHLDLAVCPRKFHCMLYVVWWWSIGTKTCSLLHRIYSCLTLIYIQSVI